MRRKQYKNRSVSKQGSLNKHRTIQLPHINRTINTVSDHQTGQSRQLIGYYDQFSWVLVPKNYEQLSSKEVEDEYKNLRRELFSINEMVEKQLNKLELRYHTKQRMVTVEPEKVNQIKEREIENNQSILRRMKKEYNGLNERKTVMPPKETLEQQISATEKQIKTTKRKIKEMTLKSKKVGDKIVGTDDVIQQMKDMEREQEVWIKRHRKLTQNLQKNAQQRQQISQKMKKIEPSNSILDEYIKEEIHEKQSSAQSSKLDESYRHRQNLLRAHKKNFESFTNTKQLKYHQLLKVLDQHQNRNQTIDEKTSLSMQRNVEVGEQIVHLEHKLSQIRKRNTELQLQKALYTPQRTVISNGNTGFSSGKPRTVGKYSHYNYSNQNKGPISKGSIKKDASSSVYSTHNQAGNASSPLDRVVIEKIAMKGPKYPIAKRQAGNSLHSNNKIYNKKTSKSTVANLASQNNSVPVTAKNNFEWAEQKLSISEGRQVKAESQYLKNPKSQQRSDESQLLFNNQFQTGRQSDQQCKQSDRNIQQIVQEEVHIDNEVLPDRKEGVFEESEQQFDKEVQFNKKLIQTHRKSYTNLSKAKGKLGDVNYEQASNEKQSESPTEREGLILDIDLGKIESKIQQIQQKSNSTRRSASRLKGSSRRLNEENEIQQVDDVDME